MEKGKMIRQLKAIAEDPVLYLRDWKERTGKKILGYFCTHTPEEMIQAGGLLPVRILSSRETISLASRHLQIYSCSLLRSSLEAGLRGELDFLDGTVFPHTCDSIQRLSDIWAENLKFPFHWDLNLPVRLDTEGARTYLAHELRRFRRGLEEFTGQTLSDQSLRESMALFNENRSLLREIYHHRTRHPDGFSAPDFEVLIKTAAFMPKEDHNSSLKQLISQLAQGPPSSQNRVPLFLAGSVCDQPQVYDLLEACGASVAGDDFCTGWRYFAEDASLQGDPIEALADRFLRKPPCPCKYNPKFDRGENFRQRVEVSKARGVVFLLLKFCDPHAFDYPYLKEKLEQLRVPSLLLELEPGRISQGGVETRLRAFVETLESVK